MEEEGKKQVDSNLSSSFPSSSSSSLADDIFGPKRTPNSDDTVFGSIFPSPSQPKSVEFDKNKHKEHHPQEQSSQPCHLSSSIYYGGRDVYSDSNENKDANRKSATIKKDGGEDDPGSASRGNWWQGSLYY